MYLLMHSINRKPEQEVGGSVHGFPVMMRLDSRYIYLLSRDAGT